MSDATYREAPRSYASSLAILAVLGIGVGIDAVLGGAGAHVSGWLIAAALLVGIDALIVYAARATRTITLTADILAVGEDAVARKDIAALEPEVDPALPVLGMALTRQLPRRVPGLALRLRDETTVVVPTRHPDRLAAALGVGRARLEVRPAGESDLALLDDIDERADTVFRVAGYDLPELPPLEAAPRTVLVAGTPPFGFVRVDEVDGSAHIQEVAVLPSHMRRGVGTALVEAACDWARGRGYRAVTLTTYADIPWNRPFYERLGFRVTDELTPDLRRRLEHEKPLEVVGERVVMRRAL